MPNLKLYYRDIGIKIVWYWHKNKHADQWKKTQVPNISIGNPSH